MARDYAAPRQGKRAARRPLDPPPEQFRFLRRESGPVTDPTGHKRLESWQDFELYAMITASAKCSKDAGKSPDAR